MRNIILLAIAVWLLFWITETTRTNNKTYRYYQEGVFVLPPPDTLKPYDDGGLVEVAELVVSHKAPPKKRSGGLYSFMAAVARAESGGDIYATNQFGMLGKYQFSPRTLAGMGVEIPHDEFLSNEQIQDSVMIEFTKQNYRVLRKSINKYNNTWQHGVYITKSGLLAGAHLVGVGGVLSFLYPEQYPHKTQDGNGTHVAYYIERFANYNISF